MNHWNKQLADNRNWGKPSKGGLRKRGVRGDRDGLIREVLQKIAAQVCMNVI